MNSNTNSSKIIKQCLAESTKFVPTQEETANSQAWTDPLPLPQIDLLPVKPFDCQKLLPEAFQSYVEDAAHRTQVPPDLIAIPLVVSFSNILGRAYRINPKQKDDWEVVANLWGIIIARSGSLKTNCLDYGTKPLKLLEAKGKKLLEVETEKYKEDIDEHEMELKILKDLYTKEKKTIIEKNANGTHLAQVETAKLNNLKNQINELTKNAPILPIEKRFISNDPTIEKLHEIISTPTCNGISVIRDELIGLLVGWEKSGHEQDRGFFLEGWNGNGSYQIDRIGRGSHYAENICISVLGGTQPDKIQAYVLKNTSPLHNDGLIQRFQLMVYPDAPLKFEYVDKYANFEAKNKVYQIAETIESCNFLKNSKKNLNESSDIEIIKFRFDKEAQELFVEWYTNLKNRLKKEENTILEEHLSKYSSLIPSLALIFHITEIAEKNADAIDATPVNKSALEMAIEWGSYLESHARRVYHMGTNIAPRAAEVLYNAIKDGKLKDDFTVRDVYRNRWQIIGHDKDVAQDACDELVKINILREKRTSSRFQQKTKVEYLINPKIFDVPLKNNPDFIISDPRVSTLSAHDMAYIEKNNYLFEGQEDEEYDYTEGGSL